MEEEDTFGEIGKSGGNKDEKPREKVGQEQIHSLIFEEKLSWQQIIHDLINSEQLDPWDIDIGVLANKFLGRVRELEEANFFVSSQVLLAASLLLRFKSEILLNRDIPDLDAILYGRKEEEKKYHQERIELDEEIPGLVLRTPLPRFRKVTLEELMNALSHAIKTENRRIRKVIVAKQQEIETALSLPKHRINLKDKIREVYSKLKEIFSKREHKLAFSELAGKGNDNRIATFIPLLHLDNQHKVWLEQNGHLEEIWVMLKQIYEKQNAELLKKMREDSENAIDHLTKEEQERVEEIEKNYKDPLGELTGFESVNKEIDELDDLEESKEENIKKEE